MRLPTRSVFDIKAVPEEDKDQALQTKPLATSIAPIETACSVVRRADPR
jgi:hypothetical protein